MHILPPQISSTPQNPIHTADVISCPTSAEAGDFAVLMENATCSPLGLPPVEIFKGHGFEAVGNLAKSRSMDVPCLELGSDAQAEGAVSATRPILDGLRWSDGHPETDSTDGLVQSPKPPIESPEILPQLVSMTGDVSPANPLDQSIVTVQETRPISKSSQEPDETANLAPAANMTRTETPVAEHTPKESPAEQPSPSGFVVFDTKFKPSTNVLKSNPTGKEVDENAYLGNPAGGGFLSSGISRSVTEYLGEKSAALGLDASRGKVEAQPKDGVAQDGLPIGRETPAGTTYGAASYDKHLGTITDGILSTDDLTTQSAKDSQPLDEVPSPVPMQRTEVAPKAQDRVTLGQEGTPTVKAFNSKITDPSSFDNLPRQVTRASTQMSAVKVPPQTPTIVPTSPARVIPTSIVQGTLIQFTRAEEELVTIIPEPEPGKSTRPADGTQIIYDEGPELFPAAFADRTKEPFRDRSFAAAFNLHAASDTPIRRATQEMRGEQTSDQSIALMTNTTKTSARRHAMPSFAEPFGPNPSETSIPPRISPLQDLKPAMVIAHQWTDAPGLKDQFQTATSKLDSIHTRSEDSSELAILKEKREPIPLPNSKMDLTIDANGGDPDIRAVPKNDIRGQNNVQPLEAAVSGMLQVTSEVDPVKVSLSSEADRLEGASLPVAGNGVMTFGSGSNHTLMAQGTPGTALAQVSQGLQTFVRQENPDLFNLTLSPDELGQLRFEMTTKGDRLHISLFVERAETMELLRRNVDQLLGDLRQSGFGQTSLSFGNWSHREQGKGERPASLNPIEVSEASAPPSLPIPRLITANGRLDLRF